MNISNQTNEKAILDQVGGSVLKVLYKPNLASHVASFIRYNVTPSMSNEDEDSHQYELWQLEELLEDITNDAYYKNPACKKLDDEDKRLLEVLLENYHYLEF